jgi:drug/metabolite transporter (DMT)-like permease
MTKNADSYWNQILNESIKLLLVTSLALIAFAANSVFCRLALEPSHIDPASFTSIRIISGAVAMAIILKFQTKMSISQLARLVIPMKARDWSGAILLFAYAIFFSFAYTLLDTATGALILFATVQFCLLFSQILKGHRFNLKEVAGILLAFAGFTALTLPNASRPDLIGLILMVVAGVAWAGYTLAGKLADDPTKNTGENFLRCIPLALVVWLAFKHQFDLNLTGVIWAVLSGVLASGIGYSLWYYAVKKITITQAAISQLLVPIIAGIGGVLLVNESLSSEFLFSAVLILLGVALVSLARSK